MTKTADNAATENAKKAMEADKKVIEKSRAEYASRMKGKPTPTQEELDLANCGAHILEHEPDGSDPDPFNAPAQEAHRQEGHQSRTLEPQHTRAPYQTRSTRPSSE